MRGSRLNIALVASLVLLASVLVAPEAWPNTPEVGRAWTAGPAKKAGVFEGPVPRARCDPGSRPETALQGSVPIADRESGRSSEGYTCNLEQVGNYPGEGAGIPLAWYGDCAYYGTHPETPPSPEAGFPGTPEKRGTIVLDVSDSASPRFSTNLTTPAMLASGESLTAHEGRGLLGASLSLFGHGPPFFDVYDVASDCARPRLLASVPVNGIGHEGTWSPDGFTYYATGWTSRMLMAIDVSDPADPKPIGPFFASTTIHGLGVSQDGKRLYLAHENDDHPITWWAQRPSVMTSNGLGIYDVSEIQERKPNPQMRLIGEVNWTDGTQGQRAVPFTSRGQPYVVFTDEGNYGGPRIIDISDETNPRIVSKLKLEIQMPENRELAHREAFTYNNEGGGLRGLFPFGYNSHYCTPDRLEDPTILACSTWESGIRVFDIRDVHAPKEIAYFNPGGDGKRRPASLGGTTSGFTSAQPRIIRERGEIWFTDMDRGFYVVRFTNDIWPFTNTPARERRGI